MTAQELQNEILRVVNEQADVMNGDAEPVCALEDYLLYGFTAEQLSQISFFVNSFDCDGTQKNK